MIRYFEPSDYGACADGSRFCTHEFQQTLDAAGIEGGTVLIRAGCVYKIGTVYIRSHTRIYLESNSRILGSNDLAAYAKDTGINPYYPEMIDRCLIYAKDVEDIVIEGSGTIDGGCDGVHYIYPEGAQGREAKQRPMLLRLECSRGRDHIYPGRRLVCTPQIPRQCAIDGRDDHQPPTGRLQHRKLQ